MPTYLHQPAGTARVIELLGQKEEILAETERSTVFLNTLPKGLGVPMHIHRNMDEGCWVVEGRLVFVVDGNTLHVEKGDYVYVERGLVHGFVAAEDAQLLWTCTPGGYSAFFEALSQVPIGPEGPDFGAMAALAAAHQTELVGPPPSLT
jgi:quercetin dioxygenase-like cupin family protein